MGYKKKYHFSGRSWEDVQEELAEDDVHAEMYCESNSIIRWLFNKRLDCIYDYIKDKKGVKLLDVGCGDGFFIDKVKNPDLDIYGVDISKKRLERAREKVQKAKLFQSKAEKMSFKDNFFDIVVCTDVLEHVLDYRQVIKELKRVTKNQGIVFVSFPNERLWTLCRVALLRFPIKIPDHLNSLTTKTLDTEFGMKKIFKKELPNRLFVLSTVLGYKVNK